jgi:dienelactone hydrolase
MFSRRNFVKSGLLGAGIGIVGNSSVYGVDCPNEALESPGPIPLNNLLVDYLEVGKKYGHGLKKVTVCDKESWEEKRLNILKRSQMMLGESPQVNKSVVDDPLVISETRRDGYKELKVQFPSGTGDLIKGYLLIPDHATVSAPRPAIIALHSTGPGASQTIGLTSKDNRGYGMELAQRGYVVLAIDTITAGERVYSGYGSYYTNEFYKAHPLWSAMDKMIYDHKKGLDYLCSLNIVDPDRLGCIGHSLGGYNSFFLQAFDSRIKAAVSSCGLSTMGQTNDPYQFARSDWFVHFNPTCRNYIQAGMIPCDMHEFMALCAPRPLFNYSATRDTIYCPDRNFDPWWNTINEALTQVSQVYKINNASENFVRVESDGGHDFPFDVREDAFRWLDKWLGME